MLERYPVVGEGGKVSAEISRLGEKDDKVFIASEEAAIRKMEINAENVYAPQGGEPVIVKVKEGNY